jgi:PAS domain S-box-containing protein
MQILLVEDNELQLKMITEFIKETDFVVHTSRNAFEAWQTANRIQPDLILLDIMMPGMSGIELCKKLKATSKLKDIPIIFLTALGNKDDIIIGLKSGAADYILKPFDKEELIARINVHLELKVSKDIIIEQNKKLKLELEKRRIAEENFRLFFHAVNSSTASVIITDFDGNIEYINPAVIQITGYHLNELQGKKNSTFKSGYHNQLFYKDLWDTIKSGNQWKGEFCNKKKNGDIFWEYSTIAPLRNEDGEFTQIVAVKVDITESKLRLEKINQYNKELEELNATKDKFFSIIAHDLKNPLSILLNTTEILAAPEYKLSATEIAEFSREIHKSSKRLYDLLENLLTWARSQTGRIEFIPNYNSIQDIVESAYSVLTHVAEAKNINIHIDLPQNAIAFCDYNMAATIFRNLISNSIKFTPFNGNIFVNIYKVYTSEDNGQKYIQFAVRDTGVGIKEEDISKLFHIDKNHTTVGTAKEKGTGLGLLLCKEFIDKHKGKIEIKSEIGVGTTFYFSLPLSDTL